MTNSQLDEFLINNHLVVDRYLWCGRRKRFRSALVSNERGKWFLKIASKASDSDARQRLNDEAEFYLQQRDNPAVPNLYLCSDGCFLTEYVESTTLRSALEGRYDPVGLVESRSAEVAKALQALNLDGHDTRSEDAGVASVEWLHGRLIRKFKDLLLGVPRNQRRSYMTEIMIRGVYILLQPILRRRSRQLARMFCGFPSVLGSRYHGDLHCDNILLSESGELYLIDFECSENKPGKILDAACFCATYAAHHQFYVTSKHIMQTALEFPEGDRTFEYAFDIFYAACRVNPQFRNSNNGRLQFSEVWGFLGLLFRGIP